MPGTQNSPTGTITPNPDPALETPVISTPPINDGNVDTTGEATRQLYFAALRDQQQENQRLQNIINAQQNRTVEPQLSPEERWNNFTSNPAALIDEAVARQTRPLNEFIAKMERNEKWNVIKRMYRTNPQYKMILDNAEGYVDNLLGTNEPSNQLLEMALMNVAGGIATGQINIPGFSFGTNTPTPTPTPAPVPTPAPRSNVTPPNLPPSSTPLPNNNQATPPRQLTENERRLARQWNMTDEDFLKGMEGESVTAPKREGK